MIEDTELTDDQKRRIKATLKRIREGLMATEIELSAQPSHVFFPKAFDHERK